MSVDIKLGTEIDEVEAKVKQHNPEVLVSSTSGYPSIH
jgi:hypothetical protein